VSPALFALIALLAGSCQEVTGPIDEPDAGSSSVQLRGRVVNFESCYGVNGCRPVEGVRVRLRSLPSYVSAPTASPGRFALRAPVAHEDDILVDPELFAFAPTVNPWAAPPAVSDVYGIELYVLPLGVNADGSDTIVTALEGLTPPIQLVDRAGALGEGGYIGQVLRQDEEGRHAVAGASVEVILPDEWPAGVPEPEVRYIASIPRYEAGDVLYAPEYPATGPFGLFVIPTGHQAGVITVHVATSDTIFSEVVAAVAPGLVTLGIHHP
jgi:hypothetical protein